MKSFWRAATNGGVALAIGCLSCASPGAAPTSAAVRAVVDRENAALDIAFRGGDAIAAAGLMTDDVVLSLIGVPDWVGRETVQRHLAELFAANTVAAHTFTPTEVEVYGDVAFERGDLTWIGGPKGKPAPPATHARYTLIRRRGSDGSWHIRRYIENAAVPSAG